MIGKLFKLKSRNKLKAIECRLVLESFVLCAGVNGSTIQATGKRGLPLSISLELSTSEN